MMYFGWEGYRHGLLAYKNDQLFQFEHGKGKLNHNVWTILEDTLGYFWMSFQRWQSIAQQRQT